MLNSLRFTLPRIQLQQVRLGHRVRGRPPVNARTLKERLDELNFKDELYTTRIDIGFPREKGNPSEVRAARTQLIKKNKANQSLEQSARNHQLAINTEEAKQDWLETIGPYHKKQIAEHYSVFEHLYGEGYFIPYLNLEVSYGLEDGSDLPVFTGNVVKPSEASNEPNVSYASEGNDLWTLALTNLDGNLKENDKEYVHWLIANIPGNFLEKGDTIVEYLKPFPLKGTGYHRYVFVLYKQNGKVDYNLSKITGASLDNRTFTTRSWYQKHQDVITPAGLAFFQSDWDISVKEFFHHTLDMKEPVYEYDFPAPYHPKQVHFPVRKAFNLYMDRYRDPKQINKEYLLRKLKEEDPFRPPKPPLRFPNAHPLPHSMPSWLKLHEKKIRLGYGRINEV